jgi:hypothetical protein
MLHLIIEQAIATQNVESITFARGYDSLFYVHVQRGQLEGACQRDDLTNALTCAMLALTDKETDILLEERRGQNLRDEPPTVDDTERVARLTSLLSTTPLREVAEDGGIRDGTSLSGSLGS